jgi:hypothetical protein
MAQLPMMDPEDLDEYFNHCSMYGLKDRAFIERVIERAHQLVSSHLLDAELRKEHPILQAMWDEYQVTRKLVLSSGAPIVNT